MSLQLDRHGWLKPGRGVSLTPSPNFNDRPRGTAVTLLVIHNISLPPGEFGLAALAYPNRVAFDTPTGLADAVALGQLPHQLHAGTGIHRAERPHFTVSFAAHHLPARLCWRGLLRRQHCRREH